MWAESFLKDVTQANHVGVIFNVQNVVVGECDKGFGKLPEHDVVLKKKLKELYMGVQTTGIRRWDVEAVDEAGGVF